MSNIEDFQQRLLTACVRDTSADPDGWSERNPLWGHCAVVALAAQERFGGTLLRASLEHVPEFSHMRSHYWNRLPDGSEHDFTKSQFGAFAPTDLRAEERTRSYLLSNEQTMERFKALAWRLAVLENQDEPLFKNDLYRLCYKAALGSGCQKMRFGCLLVQSGNPWQLPTVEACNAPLQGLEDLCEPRCIRLSIKSRTNSMVGACGHAEEVALWKAVKLHVPLNWCDLYVAGVNMNGSPWIKNKVEHTCLRCAVQMLQARVRRIFVPVAGDWKALTPEQAVQDAKAYALATD